MEEKRAFGGIAAMTGGVKFALLAAALQTSQGAVSMAMAQETVESAPRLVSISPGPLTAGLNALAAQTGLQILFDASMTEGRTTQGASGAMSPDQALGAVLSGTGVDARFAGANQVVLSPRDPELPAEGSLMLEPLVVYGNRATTALESTGASVGIVGAQAIEDGHIRDMRDSFRRLGNVMDGAFANSGFVIRGMSSEGFVPAGAPVGSVYLDGVLQTRYNARRAGGALWDTEQVEVYRGPQSTLSGRAAMSGAIYIKTKDPTWYPEAEVAVTGGNNELVGTSFLWNAPLIEDKLALRIAGSLQRAETTVDYPTYERFAGYDDFRTEIADNLRFKLLYQPEGPEGTSVLLNYSYSNDRPNERLIGEGADFSFEDERGDWYFIPTYAEFRETSAHNVGLEITRSVADGLLLTSMTGLNLGTTTRNSVDYGTRGSPDGIDGKIDDNLITQEFRLNYEDETWRWVAGVFGSFQEFDSRFDAVAVPYLQLSERFNRKTDNLALFGEAAYTFAPQWALIAGGRVDYLRERTWQSNVDTYPYGGVPFAYDNHADFDEVNFVPKLGVSYQLDARQTLALTYSEGFRTGGFYVNYRTGQPEYYDPEYAQSLELSYKGRLLDDRLALNANLFYTRYRDQQVEIRPDPNNQSYRETTNAASSNAWGFEIEPTWQVTDQLSTFASIGYLRTEFDTFDHASYGDLAGEPFPEAPEWTLAFGAHRSFANGVWLAGDAKYTSSYLGSFGIPPQDKIESRFIVNLQAGYRRDAWEISAFAENLFDEQYFTFVDRDAVPAYAQIGPRRSVGVVLRAWF